MNTPNNSPFNDPDDTITFKRSHFFAALLPIAFVLGLAVGYLFWGRSPGSGELPVSAAPASTFLTEAATEESPDVPESEDQAAAESEQTVQRYPVPVDDDPAIGPEDAPITLIEFSDYECPYCKRWHDEVFDRLRAEYPDQVRFVYRDFPLTSIHPNAEPAAMAANCAHEQDAFWEFHDKLFEQASGLSQEAYISYAEELDLDMDSFTECVESERYKAEVQGDMQYAVNLGIRSTPTFFLNGLPLVGAQPYEVFQEVIEKELAGEIP